jgi:hypothetical protein
MSDARPIPTPSLSPSLHPPTPESEDELHSPPSHLQPKGYTPSPLHAENKFNGLSLNEPVRATRPLDSVAASIAPSIESTAYPAHELLNDSYFPLSHCESGASLCVVELIPSSPTYHVGHNLSCASRHDCATVHIGNRHPNVKERLRG